MFKFLLGVVGKQNTKNNNQKPLHYFPQRDKKPNVEYGTCPYDKKNWCGKNLPKYWCWFHNFYFIPKSTSSVLPKKLKNLLKNLVLQKLVSTKKISLLITNKSIYFVNKKEVEWRRKKLGWSPITITIQQHHSPYYHTKNISTNNTTIRSSLHYLVLHTCVTKNYYYLCAKKCVTCAFNALKNAGILAFA